MYWKFFYNEIEPSYNSYINLLKVLGNKSEEFYKLDDIFYNSYNYQKLLKYEKQKKQKVLEMFKIIIDNFSILNKIPCAIYINGSYARNSITARSDLDLTFYFEKNDIDKYKTLVYLIRYAISKMLNVNIVHVHSFTKNFTTKYRKENDLIEYDQNLETDIIWNSTGDKLKINYPENQMITEREICEITSIKCIDDLLSLIKKRLDENIPKEWMYTYECIHMTNDYFDVDNKIKSLDRSYDNEIIKKFLINIKNEILSLSDELKSYFNELKLSNNIKLGDFNMYGKRKVTLLINTFATYLKWYYTYNENYDFIEPLDIEKILNYNSVFNINKIKENYYYYKYLLSRIEIWTVKFNHHFEHRSKEIVTKKIIKKEYYDMWKNDYNEIEEQINTFNDMNNEIINLLNSIKI